MGYFSFLGRVLQNRERTWKKKKKGFSGRDLWVGLYRVYESWGMQNQRNRSGTKKRTRGRGAGDGVGKISMWEEDIQKIEDPRYPTRQTGRYSEGRKSSQKE